MVDFFCVAHQRSITSVQFWSKIIHLFWIQSSRLQMTKCRTTIIVTNNDNLPVCQVSVCLKKFEISSSNILLNIQLLSSYSPARPHRLVTILIAAYCLHLTQPWFEFNQRNIWHFNRLVYASTVVYSFCQFPLVQGIHTSKSCKLIK